MPVKCTLIFIADRESLDDMSEIKKHYDWADVLRAFAMYSVVLAHLGAYSMRLSYFCFGFIMQLFFFVSGLFARSYINLEFTELLKKIGKNLLIPHLFLSAINIIYAALTGRDEWYKAFLECFLAIREKVMFPPMWFLPCLSLMIVIYWGINRLVKNPLYVLIICMLISMVSRVFLETMFWIWSANSALMFLFYYAAGCYAFPIITRFDEKSWDTKKVLASAGLFVVSLAVTIWTYYIYNSDPVNLFGYVLGTVEHQMLRFFASLFTILLFVIISHVLQKVKLLQIIGKHTIVTFALESIGSDLMVWSFWMLGITWIPRNDWQVVAYALGQLLFRTFILAVPLCMLFPRLLGRKKKEKEIKV